MVLREDLLGHALPICPSAFDFKTQHDFDLHVAMEVAPELLYTEGPLAHEFPRTVSRLTEMQSSEFLAREHRTVDTRLT